MDKDYFKRVPKRQWIKMAVMLFFYLLFCVWVGSPWLYLGVLLIFDGYITKVIPWRWWEKSKSATLRSVMKFVEDLVVVVLLVHIFFTFFFQNFKIPTSSLEKSYLVGDYLLVSKLSYGPRVPMTPIAMPLLHNTFPWGGKTYLDHPQSEYRRLAGFGSVKRNDVVVFNFPAGDTVATKIAVPDYYALVHTHGRETVWSDKQTFGDIIYRPVDKREHYVKRCVGMPGDSLQIVNNELYINGKRAKDPKEMQLNYFVQTNGTPFRDEELKDLGIAEDDVVMLSGSNPQYQAFYSSLGLDTIYQNDYGLVYQFPLTQAMHDKIEKFSKVKKVLVEPSPSAKDEPTYPVDMETGWTRDNYGPIWIPKKGTTIRISPENLPLYEKCIRNYEGHTLSQKNGRILVDGIPTDTYTFRYDYYFMMGDNRHRSADSRFWGFVPEDHIVGKPLWVWISFDKDKGLFNGKIRWSRIFLPASKIK